MNSDDNVHGIAMARNDTTDGGTLRAGQPPADPWTVVLLTCRPFEVDFRAALAEQLAAQGHDVHYVFLKRRPELRRLSSNPAPQSMTLVELFTHLKRLRRSGDRVLFLNSTNLAFPVISILLRYSVGGLWCWDLHDDLVYAAHGWRRLTATATQAALIKSASLTVHAAPTLKEIAPQSVHLGNASDLKALARDDFGTDAVLILASLDDRFDFAFMERTASLNPHRRFDIFGQVSRNDAETSSRLHKLRRLQNIRYFGPYVNANLPEILGSYSVTIAPYRMQSRLTRYIDPLRFYHCLNSGLEVICTDIPAAREAADLVHVIDRPESLGPLLDDLAHDPTTRRNPGTTAEQFNWG